MRGMLCKICNVRVGVVERYGAAVAAYLAAPPASKL